MINNRIKTKIKTELFKKYPKDKERIKIGVEQAANLWAKEDGTEKNFYDFCLNNFKTGEELESIFKKFETNLEYINGYLTALYLRLRINLDEDTGNLGEVDKLFANLNPLTHFTEDMFKTKLAFVILLNYPIKNLKEIIKNKDRYSRKEWAEIRIGQYFSSRVPSEISRKISDTYSKCAEYVYSYYINMSKIADINDKKIFEELKLISHWGLRDQIKLYYAENNEENINKQKTIYKIMENVVLGSVPDEFIENKEKDAVYNPFKYEYNGKKIKLTNSRYKNLLNIFNAHKEEDKYHLSYPNYIDRVFNQQREIPFEEAERMLKEILSSAVGKEIGNIIKRKMNRKLEVFDIWYNGFRDNSVKINLDDAVKKRYPTIEDFQKGIKDILIKLDFDKKTAEYLSEKIEVDPSRGAGHAWGPRMRGEKAHLRTRVIDAKYMNWQGFNTAMHELGHCVEQIFTLYDVDYYSLTGVPNTAFTEAFAFVFQNKSLEILGIKPSKDTEIFNSIQTFWDTREIAGVALVDMYIWKWMYEKQKFDENELREKVIEISRDIWNKYFYPIFDIKNSPILGVYSHMIYHGLYLPDYPLGHIIAYQIEEYFKDKSIGREMKRICQLGNITPLKWMKEATGKELNAKELINGAQNSIEILKEKV
ncbi:MAG TPA: hypothetical protein PK103_04805 [Elusimicrobiales bacterium]|nr:hypothetical protein [Elusimicrobiales bacterium]HPO95223.1 hypothetical protein [Elusimicrobiales bacterium]